MSRYCETDLADSQDIDPSLFLFADSQDIRDSIRNIIRYIGENPDREGLRGTPDRVIRSWEKLYGGYIESPEDILSKRFTTTCDEMVILRDIEFYSTCEHHMIPFFGKVSIGYLPSSQVIGISKLARLVECFSRRLQIQERMTRQIADAIDGYLSPQGVGVVVRAQHLCMTSRGVEKQNSVMITNSLLGTFRNDEKVRKEFLGLIGER